MTRIRTVKISVVKGGLGGVDGEEESVSKESKEVEIGGSSSSSFVGIAIGLLLLDAMRETESEFIIPHKKKGTIFRLSELRKLQPKTKN